MQSELSKVVNVETRNRLIIEAHSQYAEGRKATLVFCADVQHAKDLADLFNECGIASKAVYGAMDKEERQQVLREFSERKIQVLTNCQILTEGFDEPRIDCVIMGRPTKSASLYTQMIGRGTRTYPTKTDCLVLDFCDNATRNELCTYKNTLDGVVTSLFPAESLEHAEEYNQSTQEEKFENTSSKRINFYTERVDEIEFFETSHFAWVSVGDSWHLTLGMNRDVWVRQVNGGFLVVAQSDGDLKQLSNRPLPLDYALGVAEDWARRQTTKSAWARKDAPWRLKPASQKQLDTLSRMGVQFDHGISQGEASQLLEAKISSPATSKQLFFLRSNGIPHTREISKLEAQKLIAQAKYPNR